MTKTKDPGLGSKFKNKVDRLVNEDGTYNIKRHGGLTGVKDTYKALIDMKWSWFMGLIFLIFLLINALFALFYLAVGIDNISGLNKDFPPFLNAFFFSVQTITSVGYGQLSPTGMGANIIASFESFMGVVSIALTTGLLYGRFSRPVSKIAFSHNIILTPYKEGNALMFKMVNKRNSILLNSSVRVMLILDKNDGKHSFDKEYHLLPPEIGEIHFFPLTWTIVHAIDDNSPLKDMSIEEITQRGAEVIILVEAFDETHNQSIIERHSYGGEQWKDKVKFAKIFSANEEGKIDLYINEIDKLIPLDD